MSGLNLNPNPAVLATQAAIFLTSLFAVKTLMVNPYLKIREKRQQSTLGSKNEASSILTSNAQALKNCDMKIADAISEARSAAEKIKQTAVEQKQALLTKAQHEAQQTLKAMETTIVQTLANERQKIPQIVEQLASICFDQTIH